MIKRILVFMYSTHYSRQILNKLDFNRQIREKYSNITFHKNPSSGNRDVPCERTDEQPDVTGFSAILRTHLKIGMIYYFFLVVTRTFC